MVHIHPHGLIVNFAHKSCLSVTGCTLKYYSFHGLVYFHLLLSGDVELNPGPKRFSDVTKFKACISEWKCFMFLFFIILSMFIFDHVLTYPFRTLCMRNSSCNSTESNLRQHFELNLHHVVRICPNLINMTHQVLISVAKRSRRMMFKQYLSKRSYFYARLLLLLLLLAGDVERNPGPIQDVIKEYCLQSESTTFIGDKTCMYSILLHHFYFGLEEFYGLLQTLVKTNPILWDAKHAYLLVVHPGTAIIIVVQNGMRSNFY